MGIEKFFNSLAKNETIKENGIILGLKNKISANYLYIDFNSVEKLIGSSNSVKNLSYYFWKYLEEYEEEGDDRHDNVCRRLIAFVAALFISTVSRAKQSTAEQSTTPS